MNVFNIKAPAPVTKPSGTMTPLSPHGEPAFAYLFPLIGIFIIVGMVVGLRIAIITGSNSDIPDAYVTGRETGSTGGKPAAEFKPVARIASFVYPLPTGWEAFSQEGLTLYHPPQYRPGSDEITVVGSRVISAVRVLDDTNRTVMSVFSIPYMGGSDEETIQSFFREKKPLPDSPAPDGDAERLTLNKRIFTRQVIDENGNQQSESKGGEVILSFRSGKELVCFRYDSRLEDEEDTFFRILTMIATSQLASPR